MGMGQQDGEGHEGSLRGGGRQSQVWPLQGSPLSRDQCGLADAVGIQALGSGLEEMDCNGSWPGWFCSSLWRPSPHSLPMEEDPDLLVLRPLPCCGLHSFSGAADSHLWRPLAQPFPPAGAEGDRDFLWRPSHPQLPASFRPLQRGEGHASICGLAVWVPEARSCTFSPVLSTDAPAGQVLVPNFMGVGVKGVER